MSVKSFLAMRFCLYHFFRFQAFIEDYTTDVRPEKSKNIIEDITLLEADVLSVLYNLDVNKAQGPDGILARLLKETARALAKLLRR